MNRSDFMYEDRRIVRNTIESLELAERKLDDVIEELIDGLQFAVKEYNELQSWKGKSGEKAQEDLQSLCQQLSNRIYSLQEQKGKLINERRSLEITLYSSISFF